MAFKGGYEMIFIIYITKSAAKQKILFLYLNWKHNKEISQDHFTQDYKEIILLMLSISSEFSSHMTGFSIDVIGHLDDDCVWTWQPHFSSGHIEVG